MNDAQIILQLILIFIQTILFGLSLLYTTILFREIWCLTNSIITNTYYAINKHTTILPFILWAAFYFITKLNFIIQLI